MAMRQSHSVNAMFVVSIPCIPIIPSPNGCSSDIAPLPINVVQTGIFVSVANSRSSSDAFARITPPPTSINGFCELLITSIAFLICFTFPFVVGL